MGPSSPRQKSNLKPIRRFPANTIKLIMGIFSSPSKLLNIPTGQINNHLADFPVSCRRLHELIVKKVAITIKSRTLKVFGGSVKPTISRIHAIGVRYTQN